MPDRGADQPPAEFTFARRGRSAASGAAAGGWLAALAVLWLGLDAAPLLAALLALPLLPVLIDLIRNPSSGMRITARQIEWHSGRLSAAVQLAELDHVRLDTRWDFSVRATLVLADGQRIRLPQEATAPHRQLAAALSARGIACTRHHFTPF